MNAKDMTKEFFTNVLFAHLEFKSMTADDFEAFGGAGKYCLMANVEVGGNDFIVLAEQGTFNIYGFDDDGEMWCFAFYDHGQDGQLSQLF